VSEYLVKVACVCAVCARVFQDATVTYPQRRSPNDDDDTHTPTRPLPTPPHHTSQPPHHTTPAGLQRLTPARSTPLPPPPHPIISAPATVILCPALHRRESIYTTTITPSGYSGLTRTPLQPPPPDINASGGDYFRRPASLRAHVHHYRLTLTG